MRSLFLHVSALNDDEYTLFTSSFADNDNWKRFGDYWRRQNVETTRDSPSITLAYEERGEENTMYRLPLVTRTMNKIIVRDFYKSFYDYILKLRDYITPGVVLTGQPGTGASSS
jgi:hypothetical protein